MTLKSWNTDPQLRKLNHQPGAPNCWIVGMGKTWAQSDRLQKTDSPCGMFAGHSGMVADHECQHGPAGWEPRRVGASQGDGGRKDFSSTASVPGTSFGLPTSSGGRSDELQQQSRSEGPVLAIVQAMSLLDFDATTVPQGAYAKNFATNSDCRNSLAALEILRFACHTGLFCGPSPTHTATVTMIWSSQGSLPGFGDSTANKNARPGDAIS